MERYRSPAIRLQLLNSITIALGARRRFYRMNSLDPIERAAKVTDLLDRTRRLIQRYSAIMQPVINPQIWRQGRELLPRLLTTSEAA